MKSEPSSRLATAGRLALPLLLASSAACSQPPAPAVHSSANSGNEGTVVAQASNQLPVANLPFAQGRSFATLDEYLEFRKARGAYDVPWYRPIKPGMYELVSFRAPGAERQVYSRVELARKFGFKE